MTRCYTLSHKSVFIFGYTYYLLTPLILGYSGAFEGFDSLNLLNTYFDPSHPAWPFFLLFSLAAPAMYLLGSFRTPNLIQRCISQRGSNGKTGAWVLLPVYGLMLALFAFQGRSQLFTGYNESVEISLQGSMATLQMLMLYQYLYERTSRVNTASAFGVLLCLNSLLLLGLGGRLYVLCTLVAIYFRWWNWGAQSTAVQLRSLGLILLVPVMMIAVGMWRVGETNVARIGFYVVAESLFTSISSFTLFTGGNWSVVDLPHEFLVAFLNIVPSVLWPAKAEWLAANTLQSYESPYGAVSIVASSVGNFGFIGGLLFFFCVGFYMSSIGRTRGKSARIAYYSYLVGLLPFMFFRDPFQIQVKVVVTGFILYWITILFSWQFWQVKSGMLNHIYNNNQQ